MKYAIILFSISPVYAQFYPLHHNGLRLSIDDVSLQNDPDASPEIEAFYRYKNFFLNPSIQCVSFRDLEILYKIIAGFRPAPEWYIGTGVNLDHIPGNGSFIKAAALAQILYTSEKFDAFLRFSTSGDIQWRLVYYDRWILPVRLSLSYSNDPQNLLWFAIRPEFSLYFSPEIAYDFYLTQICLRGLFSIIPEFIVDAGFALGLNEPGNYSVGISATIYFEKKS